MLIQLQSAVALFTCGCLISVAASPSNVGFIVTNGDAQVDGTAVHGNSTLFPGSLVKAGNATSDLMFPGGSNLLLQPESAVKVYRDYAVLQSGAAVQRGTHGLMADGVRISSLSAAGSIAVGVKDKSHLEVAAQGAPAEVRTPTGTLVARLVPGKTLTLSIQAAQQTPASPDVQQSPPAPVFGLPQPAGQVTIHGVLRKDHAGRYGHYLLTDEATKTTYELQGSGLEDLVGASVEATGSIYDTTPAEGASKVVSVSDIHQMNPPELPGSQTAAPSVAEDESTPGGNAAPANGAGATPTSPPGAPQPPATSDTAEATAPPVAPLPVHSDTAKIILIVGIAAGGAVGVALGLGGGKSSTVSPE